MTENGEHRQQKRTIKYIIKMALKDFFLTLCWSRITPTTDPMNRSFKLYSENIIRFQRKTRTALTIVRILGHPWASGCNSMCRHHAMSTSPVILDLSTAHPQIHKPNQLQHSGDTLRPGDGNQHTPRGIYLLWDS